MSVLTDKIAEILYHVEYFPNKWKNASKYCKVICNKKATAIIKNLTIEDFEAIINEKRYEIKAQKMREADARD